MRLNPLPPAFYFLNYGHAYRSLGRLEEAIDMYKKTIALTPDNIFAHINLAACCAMTGKEEEARAAAKEVLRINPKFSVGQYMKISPRLILIRGQRSFFSGSSKGRVAGVKCNAFHL
jgi:adenylate cyclase